VVEALETTSILLYNSDFIF